MPRLQKPRRLENQILHKKKEKFDVEIRVGNLKQKVNNSLPSFFEKLDSTYFYFMPMAFLISLFLASPVNLKRKIYAIISGLIVFYLVFLFRLYVMVNTIALSHESLEFAASPIYKKTINFLNDILISNGAMILFIDLFIWIIFTFRREDVHLLTTKNFRR